MDFSTLGNYTLEGSGTLLLVVVAYKIYKLRVTTESDCCHHAFKLKSSSRGDSQTDLQIRETEMV